MFLIFFVDNYCQYLPYRYMLLRQLEVFTYLQPFSMYRSAQLPQYHVILVIVLISNFFKSLLLNKKSGFMSDEDGWEDDFIEGVPDSQAVSNNFAETFSNFLMVKIKYRRYLRFKK
jgi:hypothetical protein